MSSHSLLQLTAETVASLPPPGQSGPTSFTFSPKTGRYLAFISNPSPTTSERKLCYIDMHTLSSSTQNCPLLAPPIHPLVTSPVLTTPPPSSSTAPLSLEERLRRERQRIPSTSLLTSFSWNSHLQILLPLRGNIYIQNGLGGNVITVCDRQKCGGGVAIDPQLSPDGKWVAFVVNGDLYYVSSGLSSTPPVRVTFGGGTIAEGISHGLADFVAQEEMERHCGFWWHPSSKGILFTRVDERDVPLYRISYHGAEGYEDHRYPFSGGENPKVSLGYVSIGGGKSNLQQWEDVMWLDAPPECREYLARVNWLPDGCAAVQWQNRAQTLLTMQKVDVTSGESVILLQEQSDVWINLHHMMRPLSVVIQPSSVSGSFSADSRGSGIPGLVTRGDEGWEVQQRKPHRRSEKGSFSFLFASERSGYCHLYLYTYISGDERATLVRSVSAGDWVVESIVGVDTDKNVVYATGTYDSPLERHLYALPLTGAPGVPPPAPVRLTSQQGMHNLVMDQHCRYLVDSSSDVSRPPSVKVHALPLHPLRHNAHTTTLPLLATLHDATRDIFATAAASTTPFYPPELLSFPTTDDPTTMLHAVLYKPDPQKHGRGPYPLLLSVYGGPHVQRVNRSHSQTTDMRAQRLRSLGFAVLKCDNRGSARRGLAFESCIKNRLGRVEVLDQVAAVRYLTMRGVADPNRVGVYGWSYGGYLAAMCLCRAPDVFKVAVAGAPVTSWEGYDTHYTERYMGLPSDNPTGYRESAVFEHVGNMRGKLLMVHGLIDENVHFRHTTRLINKLIASGKDYDLLLFPDERHSPRKLRDRVYMEQRISDYFVRWLGSTNHSAGGATGGTRRDSRDGDRDEVRIVAGHL